MALWVPFAWYFIASTRAIGYWFNPFSQNISFEDGSPIDRLIYSGLILIGIFILIARRIKWRVIINNNRWIFAFIAYAFISVVWSRFPEIAIKRCIRMAGSTIMVLIVLTETYPQAAVNALLRRCFIVHLPLDLLSTKFFRAIGVAWSKDGKYQMWTGLTTHKNMLGQVCMTSGMYFIWDIINRKNVKRTLVDIVYLIFGFILMNGPGLSRSTTSIIVLIVGIIVFFGLKYAPSDPRYINRFFIKSGIVISLFILFIQIGAFIIEQGGGIESVALEVTGKDETLAGRTDLWSDILTDASKNPILGVGYGSYWIDDKANNLWEKHIWRPAQGHNGYIDIYVQLGIVGIALLAGVFISTFRNIKEMLLNDFEYGRFRMALFIMIVTHNLTESSLFRSNHNLHFIFLLVAMNMPVALNKLNNPIGPIGRFSPQITT